jgi:glycosyltransferase involved in cell wall biosynthesis
VRLLVATDQWFPDRLGGVARVAAETARRWAAAGHEVVVLAPRHPGAPAEQRADGEPTVLRALPRGRVPQTLSDPRATRRLARRIDGERFDALVAHTCTTAWGLLAARVGAPLVDVFHADVAAEARYLRTAAPHRAQRISAIVLERPLRRLERVTLRDAATVVILSEFSRGLLAGLDPEAARRALLAPGGVDTDVFTPSGREEARARLGIDPATRLVLSVRRLVPRMGLETLLEATASLRDVDGLRVAIAGVGPLEGELRARRARLGLEDRVDLLGRIADEELRLWHRAADLFVLPTLAHEGFGLVTAEALASGTPVVGTRVGATPELLEPLDPRLLARDTDATSIADGVRTGLELATPELRARCRQHALRHYAWSAVMPAWERALRHALETRGRTAATATPSRSAVAVDPGRD